MGMRFDPESPQAPGGRPHRRGGVHKLWHSIDVRYMQPLFGGPPKDAADGPNGTRASAEMGNVGSGVGQSAGGAGAGPPAGTAGTESLLAGDGGDAYLPPDIAFSYDDGDIGAGTGEYFGATEAVPFGEAPSRGSVAE